MDRARTALTSHKREYRLLRVREKRGRGRAGRAAHRNPLVSIALEDPVTGKLTGERAEIEEKNGDLAMCGRWHLDDRGVYTIVQESVPLKVYMHDIAVARRDGSWIHTRLHVEDPHSPRSPSWCLGEGPVFAVRTIMGVKVVVYLHHLLWASETKTCLVADAHSDMPPDGTERRDGEPEDMRYGKSLFMPRLTDIEQDVGS